MEQCPTRWRVSARGGHTSPLLTDGLVLIVLTPGHQVFLCAARSSDPRSLSFSLYFIHFPPLRRNGTFSYHGLHKYRIPNQICTDAPKKETTQKYSKFISSRLVALIRSALSLLWAQRKGWKIESFRRSKHTRAANYTCSPLALPLLAETLIGLTSQFTAILVSFLSDSSRSCKKTPALSAWKRKFIQPKQR